MADAAVSNTAEGNLVRVRLSSPAPTLDRRYHRRLSDIRGPMTRHVSPSRAVIAPVLVVLLGLPLAGAPPVAAFAGPPTALVFTDSPSQAYAGRPFDVVVSIAAFPEPGRFVTVVDEGTSATITLAIESSPITGADLACASGRSLPTATSGPRAGMVTFTGCTLDQAGEPFRLRAVASDVTSTVSPTPVLEDAVSFPIRVAPEIDAPQDTIEVSITHNTSYPAVIWGNTVTVHVRFTLNGASKPFQLQQTTRAMTSWSRLADLVTDPDGNAAFSYRPSVSTRFRVVFQGTPDLPMGTSATPGFLLYSYAKQDPTNATPRVIRRASTVTFATTVRPLLHELAPADVWFLIYHRVAGTWKLASQRRVTVDSAGVARLPVKFGARGEWYVRSAVVARWTAGMEETAPATAWASRPTPLARVSVR